MPTTVLFDHGEHRNLLLEDYGHGLAVQANQHLIVHRGHGMILDPGGHKVYQRALSEALAALGEGKLQYLFLSHQDPDVIAAANGWLLATEAEAWCSALWTRFVPHIGLDRAVEDRLKPIPDEGGFLDLGGCELMLIPAHFLHSAGNFHVYDPVSRIYYSGDVGASLGQSEVEVKVFETHVRSMEHFHRRYMGSSRALRAWVRMVRALDIELLAPQHGAWFRGRDMVNRFLDWCEGLECGIEAYEGLFRLPRREDVTARR